MELNLPKYEVKIRKEGNATKIFDVLRNKFVALTPEEWVRQHFVHFLIDEKSYPASLMGNEIQLNLNGMSKRCDTVVYDRSLTPKMIIEYKRPDVEISQKVFDQISRYNITMRVDLLIVSNGLEHYCCRINYEEQNYEFLQDIPSYQELIAPHS
ncbi:MAG: type I restriction enzyme HsdR N-terminal domain-containing protein [Bacteroidaceae bacterium]|nr:type I restriction enzyme HsdR N-terminal domain-containing protein [Bacteroidaceae bacterium]